MKAGLEVFNFVISIFGAALNLFLLSQEGAPLFALLSVLLILRSIVFGARLYGSPKA